MNEYITNKERSLAIMDFVLYSHYPNKSFNKLNNSCLDDNLKQIVKVKFIGNI